MTERVIRNARELAEDLGINGASDRPLADLEARIARSVYKATTCGAWFALRPVETGTRHVRWTARLALTLSGVIVRQCRREHRKAVEPAELPGEVRSWLCLKTHRLVNNQTRMTHEEWEALAPDPQCYLWKVTKVSPVEKAVTFSIPQPILRPGVAVGSIVEGADPCTEEHELAFPFRISRFWAALEAVEAEAKAIWDATHGCESCARHWRAGGYVEDPGEPVPVWSKCPECKGEGVVI